MKQLRGILVPLLVVILKNHVDKSDWIHPQSSMIERNGWCNRALHLVNDALHLWSTPDELPLLQSSTLHILEPSEAEGFKEKRIVHGTRRLIVRLKYKKPKKQTSIFYGNIDDPGYWMYKSSINPVYGQPGYSEYGGLNKVVYPGDPLKINFLPPVDPYLPSSLDIYPLKYFFKPSYYNLPRVCRRKKYKVYKLLCLIRRKKGYRRFCARYRKIFRVRC